MSDDAHKSEITSLIKDLMSNIDSKPLHPKNKLLLYSRYICLDERIVAFYSFQYISNLGKRKYRFCGKQLHSSMARNTNFRNTLLRFHDSKYIPPMSDNSQNVLKNSPNVEINELRKSTSTNKNIHYDIYTTTKEVIKDSAPPKKIS